MTSTKIQQLQLLQQNLQSILVQKQQLQSHLVEIDSALTELKDTDKAYKIVGKLMIASSSKKLNQELREKKDLVEARLKNFLQQEEKLKNNLEKLQKEAVQEIQQEKK